MSLWVRRGKEGRNDRGEWMCLGKLVAMVLRIELGEELGGAQLKLLLPLQIQTQHGHIYLSYRRCLIGVDNQYFVQRSGMRDGSFGECQCIQPPVA